MLKLHRCSAVQLNCIGEELKPKPRRYIFPTLSSPIFPAFDAIGRAIGLDPSDIRSCRNLSFRPGTVRSNPVAHFETRNPLSQEAEPKTQRDQQHTTHKNSHLVYMRFGMCVNNECPYWTALQPVLCLRYIRTCAAQEVHQSVLVPKELERRLIFLPDLYSPGDIYKLSIFEVPGQSRFCKTH